MVPRGKEQLTVSWAAPTPILSMIFWLLIERVAINSLEIFKLSSTNVGSIPKEYEDLHEAFNEKASNKLLDNGLSNIKIEFKGDQKPSNTGLQPMFLIELEEVQGYLEENLDK